MKSVLAGFFIGIGATVYLTIGGVVGAAFFSVGLATILIFGFSLFTGKAGLLATNEIDFLKLVGVWFGNFIGVIICVGLLKLTPIGADLTSKAATIVAVRNGNSFITNLVLGFFCGVLMYVAVTGFRKSRNIFFIILPIVTFIMTGCNHCIADMYYIVTGANTISDFISLIPTTIGNVIGCNFIPVLSELGGKKFVFWQAK